MYAQNSVYKKTISLKIAANLFLHYTEFLPTFDWATLDRGKRLCTVLSDQKDGVYRRTVSIDEFLSVAKIAVTEEDLLGNLVTHTIRAIRKVVSNQHDEREAFEAIESIIDVMDMTRESGVVVAGEMPAYHSVINKDNMMKIDRVEKHLVDYRTLIRNLFSSWPLFPFRQFNPYINVHTFNYEHERDPIALKPVDVLKFLTDLRAIL